MANGDRAAGSSWQAKFGQTEGSGNGADAVGAGQEFTIPEAAEAVGADVDVGGLSQNVLRQDLADHRRQLETVPREAVGDVQALDAVDGAQHRVDRKSTRLNSSH